MRKMDVDEVGGIGMRGDVESEALEYRACS